MISPENSELSERELDILRLVATGLSNKEIAYQLYISPNTVKVHLRNIFAKIGVLSRTEAALYAINRGLVKTVPAPPSPGSGEMPAISLPVSTPLGVPGEAEEGLQPSKKPLRPSAWRLVWAGLALIGFVLALAGVGYLLGYLPSPSPTPAPAAFPITPVPTATLQPRWQVLPSLPSPRSRLAAAVFDGAIYAIGGETAQGISGSLTVYDPARGTWSERKPKPIPAADIQAAVLGGKIYVPGGRLAGDQVSSAFEIYDPQHDSWESGPDLPYPVSAYALAAFEGKLYLFGGWDGKEISDRLLEYDPALAAWIELSSLPSPRLYSAAVEAGGKIYLLGGFDGQNPLANNDVYTPSREGSGITPWDSAAPIPQGRYAMGAAAIADSILLIGGVGGSTNPAPSYHFFPSLGYWSEVEKPEAQPWAYLAAVPLDQKLFALGGRLGESLTGRTQSYQAVYTILIPIVR